MHIIGMDAATQDERVGLAMASVTGGRARLEHALRCGRGRTAADVIANWVNHAPGRVLLAVDAPLGWPSSMGAALSRHEAGEPIDADTDLLFRRATDRDVQRRLRKRPLDVGADRIARTAHAALRTVEEIRRRTDRAVPMAWSPDFGAVAMIEVYPAGTLKAMALPSSGYKDGHELPQRVRILEGMASRIDPAGFVELLLSAADVLDAHVCVAAGLDFLEGLAPAPPDGELARREGWIWVRSPAPKA